MTGRARPRVLDLRGTGADPDDLAPAVSHLRSGGVVVHPTETVYGLGGAATPGAVARVAALKGREPGKPFIALVGDASWVAGLAWTDAARELAGVFWPGALTLVLRDPAGIFPPGVRSDAGTVAVRMSPHPVVAALLEASGSPMTSTSANVPGGPPARSGSAALEVVEMLGGGDDVLVLDVGALGESAPSTIVDCTGAEPVVVRQGSVPVARLRCVLPEIDGIESA